MSHRRVAKGRAARERRYHDAVIRQIELLNGDRFQQNPLRYRYVDAEELLRPGDTLDRFLREITAKHHAEMMTAPVNTVVANFQAELAAAGSDTELRHLAEGRYASDLGERMRACVDYERARRTVTAGIGGAR